MIDGTKVGSELFATHEQEVKMEIRCSPQLYTIESHKSLQIPHILGRVLLVRHFGADIYM
mgnify:CR=1 FL=1